MRAFLLSRFHIATIILYLILLKSHTSIRLIPNTLKGSGTKFFNFINKQSDKLLEQRGESSSFTTVQETAYSKPSEKRGLIPISVTGNKISFLGGNDVQCTLLDGLDPSAVVEVDSTGGAFVSFTFPTSLSQHDATIGKIPETARLLAHSRIKRCNFYCGHYYHTIIINVSIIVTIYYNV
jgi:hypothetical protein